MSEPIQEAAVLNSTTAAIATMQGDKQEPNVTIVGPALFCSVHGNTALLALRGAIDFALHTEAE